MSLARRRKNPLSDVVVWTLGLGVIGATVLYIVASKASVQPAASQKPVWRPIIPKSDGSLWFPLNSTFAISVPASDAQMATMIGTSLANLMTNGDVGSLTGTNPGQSAPANFPADGLGTSAYRTAGVVLPSSNATANGGVGVIADAQTKAWLFAGVS